jgi:hypothetical protein
MTAAQLLAFAATLTVRQLEKLGLNVRADHTLSEHGR